MTWWEALLLGIVQGLTEFFPVSSSGHLVIGQELLGLAIPGILFDVTVHVATLLSVVVVYRKKLLQLLLGAVGRGEHSTWPYILKIGLATVPAVIVGFTLKDFFEARFDDAIFAGTMILITGCVVWSSRWALGTRRVGIVEVVPLIVAAGFSVVAGTLVPFLLVSALLAGVLTLSRMTTAAEEHREPGWFGALVMGVAQSVAILPGISRSGSTVLTGLWRRIDPEGAAEFSFLMSIPAILGAAVLEVPDVLRAEQLDVGPMALVSGFLGAATAGVLAISFFVAMLRRRSFHLFAYYCWAAAGLFLLYATFR
jgi:undecaprenyl-diphosphatase